MNPTPPRVSELLDLSQPGDVADYERAFYIGFQRATHNRLVRQLWDWDDTGRRLKTKIPYSDQRIWGLRAADRTIEAAIAVNVTMQQFQAAAYGFAIPGELKTATEGRRVCEFLTFFATREHGLARKQRFWTELFGDLRGLGFSHGLATCSPKVFAIYAWMGAERIGVAEIDQETRLLLRFDLRETANVVP